MTGEEELVWVLACSSPRLKPRDAVARSMPTARALLLAPLIGVFVGKRLQDLQGRQTLVIESRLSAAELHAELHGHRIVHLGGQHRAGTTLLLEGLAAHSNVAVHDSGATASRSMSEDLEHGDGSEAKADAALLTEKLHREGIFLQDVYPVSSLDHPPRFFVRRRVSRMICALMPSFEGFLLQRLPSHVAEALLPWVGCTLREGIGGYAFSNSSRLGASHAVANEAGALRLFRQWVPHWDLRRPVLVEKSPSNARAIGMLSAMWAAGRAASYSFVFISRHPLPQAFAMLAFVEPADVTLHSQLAHYLSIEESIRDDSRRHLSSVALLSLEGLTRQPHRTLSRLLSWLGLPEDEAGLGRWAVAVRPDPNAKYMQQYAEQRQASLQAEERHARLVETFGTRVSAVTGYQLDGQTDDYANPPARGEGWQRGWAGASGLELAVL